MSHTIYNSMVRITEEPYVNSRNDNEASYMAQKYVEDLFAMLDNHGNPSALYTRPHLYDYFKRIAVMECDLRDRLYDAKAKTPSLAYQKLNRNIESLLSKLNITIEQFNSIDFNDPELQSTLKEHVTLALLKK